MQSEMSWVDATHKDSFLVISSDATKHPSYWSKFLSLLMHLLFFSSSLAKCTCSVRSVVVFHYTWPNVHEYTSTWEGERRNRREREVEEEAKGRGEEILVFFSLAILWWRVFHQRIRMADETLAKASSSHHQASRSADQAERIRPIGRISSFPYSALLPLSLFQS